MAERPNRQQPFRFWLPFWASPTRTPARPPVPTRRQPQPQTRTSTPLPPANSQSPSHTQPKSPPAGVSQPPSPLPPPSRSPTLARRASQPSRPSRLDSKKEPTIQKASGSPSPAQSASQPQPVATLAESQILSQHRPSPSPPNSPIGNTSPSNQQLKPEVPLQAPAQAHETSLPQPASKATDDQPAPNPKSKLRSLSSLKKDFPADIDDNPGPDPSISEGEIQKTKEENPSTIPESNVDQQPDKLLEPEENTQLASKEQPKTKAEGNQAIKPNPINENEAETQPQKTKPTRYPPKASEIIAKLRISKPEHSKEQENATSEEPAQNGSSGKESRIAVSTMPWTSFSEGERAPFEKEINEGLSRLAQRLGVVRSEMIGNGQPVSMITFAGVNNGASMNIGSDTHVHRAFKHDNVEEERWDRGGSENPAMATGVNSNVQSINNSALHDSSCNARDPGVHLKLSSKKMEATKPRGQSEPLKPQRIAPIITPAQKPSREPRIRRRCLRALLMESSESDPEKPQRHGCRFSCEEKKNGKADLGATSTSNSNAKARQAVEGASRT